MQKKNCAFDQELIYSFIHRSEAREQGNKTATSSLVVIVAHHTVARKYMFTQCAQGYILSL